MEALIGLLELLGGIIFVFAAGHTFARMSGYGEFYDRMLHDDDADFEITIKKDDMDNDDDIIHHVSI